jgi:hypothetical protein
MWQFVPDFLRILLKVDDAIAKFHLRTLQCYGFIHAAKVGGEANFPPGTR